MFTITLACVVDGVAVAAAAAISLPKWQVGQTHGGYNVVGNI